MKKETEHIIDFEMTAKGLGLSVEQTKRFFNDGRQLGRLGEFIDVAKDGGKRMDENSAYDIEKPDGKKREIRSGKNNVSFASSKEVGYGRTVTEDGFKQKLESVDDFGIIDSRDFETEGKLVIYSLTKEDVNNLGLGKNKSMSANKFWKKIDSWN
jgi:hypothetical protein